MNKICVLGVCAVALVTIPAFPNTGLAQGKSLKDQLVGTWIYVSSTGKRDDGSTVPRPSLQGTVTYTTDGRFHFITTRTDTPKVSSSDPSRPTPEEAMSIASGSVAYTGTYTVDEATKTVHANVETSTFANLVGAPQPASHYLVHHRRRNEVHEPPHAGRGDTRVRVEAGEVIRPYR